MWNRRENPLRPAGKADTQSPQNVAGVSPRGSLAAGGHRGGSRRATRGRVPAPVSSRRGTGQGGRTHTTRGGLPQAVPPPDAAAATGAPLALGSPATGKASGGGCPDYVKSKGGGLFLRGSHAAVLPLSARPRPAQPSALSRKPAPSFCKQRKGSASPNRGKQAFVTLGALNLEIRM